LNHILMRNQTQVNQMNLNLLDSHDTHRIFTQVGNSKDKVLAALALMFIFPGVPCIYYGTEICLEGGYDPDSRRTFNWNTEEWDNEFLNNIKAIISTRKNTSIQNGD
ncbi:alpha-amylase family glycosyl hydrolase, partial [Streptococcus suis]